jgi:hypothetical protein
LNIGLIASLALANAPWASAQESFSKAATKKILQAARSFTNQGYRLLGDPYISHLDRQATERIDFQTTKGVSYVLVPVCDQYCSGIDLAVVDEEGVDVEKKEGAILLVTPRTIDPVSLRVTMTDCSENPCYYGLAIFRKSGR